MVREFSNHFFLRIDFMTKFVKISTAALLVIFLTACDKPADKTSAGTAQETQQAVATAKAKAEDIGAVDYKTFREWQQKQEVAIDDAIKAAMEKLGDKVKDPKVVEQTINQTLAVQMEIIKKDAETLTLKDPQVNALKTKSLEVLELGSKMMIEGEKISKNPTEEAHKAFSELQAQLQKLAQEGQMIEAELVEKYEPKPTATQPVPAQAAPTQGKAAVKTENAKPAQ